jgi:hypothetical protein
MPRPRRRRHDLKPDRIRALELLADAQDSVTEALMDAHGVTVRGPGGGGRTPRWIMMVVGIKRRR